MKFFFARLELFTGIAFSLAIFPCAAQTAPAPQPRGQVIFSRSTDANGETTTQGLPEASAPSIPTAAASSVTDAARRAVTFTGYDLDVHLRPADQQIAVRALVTVRNGGKTPLTCIPLEISSSLDWEEMRVDGRDVAFSVATLNSDADHTGQLHEAAVPLAQPLAPGASLKLDVTYSGAIPASARRLQAIGAPDDAARRSDWDQIGVSFTGLRGFGNVVWYPVASVPALLGDGAKLFDEMGALKLRMEDARFRLHLADEFPHGQAPTVAVLNGHSVPLQITEPNGLDQSQEVDGVATASLDNSTLGFAAPSLFVAIRTAHPALDGGANLTAWTLPDDNVSVQFWTTAAGAVTPFLQGWLGRKPRSPLTILDLPDAEDAPFATGALLAAPIREPEANAKPGGLEEALVHALTQAWIAPSDSSPPPSAWLNEGVATFMTTLWVEKRLGRDTALRMLEADRTALALAEPSSPGESAGQPLAQAISPVYYRTKAAYVLWMLRDLAGDPALSAALSACDAPATPNPTVQAAAQSGKPVCGSFEKLLEKNGNGPDLSWFFADWIDADKGLPDLSITGVYPSSISAGNWLVAVDLANAGYATAEIPLTVRSALTSITHRVRVPARGKITERILIQGKPTSVQANDGTVPETQASIHITNLDAPGADSGASSQPNPPQ